MRLGRAIASTVSIGRACSASWTDRAIAVSAPWSGRAGNPYTGTRELLENGMK